jgi:hypothetical protein
MQALPKHVSPMRGLLEALAGSEDRGLSMEELQALFHINTKTLGVLTQRMTTAYQVRVLHAW